MPSCAVEAAIDPFAASHSVFDALALELGAEEAARLGHAELEDLLELRGRDLLRQLLQDHLDLRQVREERAVRARPAPVTGADGVTRRAVETGHRRLLASIFGTVVVGRCAWRAQGQRNVYPADAALRLPRLRHSHGLRRLAALEAVRGSFDQATEAIGRRCGQVVGKRGVEQLTVAAAADIDTFYQAVAPEPCSDATVLVLSVDGKGVVMRPEALREATRQAAEVKGPGPYRTRLASGEKPARKRMATLGVVYDAEPAPRRPHDVITVPAATADGDPHTEAWVATHAISILSGHLAQAVAAIDQQAVHAGLSGNQRRGVDVCIGYLQAKQEFLGYDTALARGWPIATGVIEGACRHLIGDRLDISGARWGLDGAEAV